MLASGQGMSVYSSEYHAMMISPGKTPGGIIPISTNGKTDAGASVTASAADQPAKQHEGFFQHLWNVVNPLQHLPVIGTLYRAITGEHLDPVEKIAGDSLYGGFWGAVTSVADVAFESLTGKDVEDTVLALFKSDGSTRVASAKVSAPTITPNTSLPSSDLPSLPADTVVASNGFDVTALSNALSAKGVDSDTASRALYAYRRSMGMKAPVPVLAGAY